MAKELDEQHQRNLAAGAKKQALIKRDYEKFLQERQLPPSPDNGHSFAMNARRQGNDWGYTEKELIILVAGALPFGYD